MATYYFLGTIDSDWNEMDNWYDAPSGGNQGFNPSSSDDVFILSTCDTNSGTTPTVNNATLDNCNFTIEITVNGIFTIINSGYIGDASAIINGNVVCSTNGIVGLNNLKATINGNLTFENNGSTEISSTNTADVSGNVIFASNWTGSASDIDIAIGGNVIYTYGYSGSASNLSLAGGSTLYSAYPTLYYNAAVSNDWHNNLNWWVDSGHTQQSYDIPSSSDDVLIGGSIFSTTADMYCNNATINYSLTMSTPYALNVTSTLTVSDTYYIGDSMYAGPDIICTNAIFNGNSYVTGNTDISASGTVTFNSTSELGHSNYGGATIAGEVVFNGSSEFISGTITGNASFYDTSVFTGGTVTLNVTVYSSHPLPFTYGGTINGSLLYSGYSPRTVYFYHTGSSEDWGGNFWYDATTGGGSSTYAPNPDISLDTVIIEASVGSNTGNLDATVGSLTVNGVYVASTFVSIDITCDYANFNDSCYLNAGATLTQSVNHSGNNITFGDLSENDGTVNPDTPPVVFEDSSSNDGTVNGDVDVYYPSEKPVGGTVTGFVTYYGWTLYFGSSTDGDWNNPNNWFLDSANTSPYNDIPSDTMPYQNVILQSNVTASNQPPYPGSIGGTPSAYDLLVSYNLSITAISVDIYGLATFSDTSYLNYDATINGNALFQDSSFNNGAIVGTATFTLSSAEIMISDGYGGSYGGIEFQYGKGVNGSNILGIV